MMETKNLSLQHLIRPGKQNGAPLLFLLHGYGSNMQDLFSFANELPDEYFVVSVQAPHELMPGGYMWYAINFDNQDNKFTDTDQGKESLTKIRDFIDECKSAYPVLEGPVNLVGFSQGAILSYALSLEDPQKYRSVVAMSGYIETDLIKKDRLEVRYSESDHPTLPSYFISHGTMDQVIPVAWGAKAPEILDSIGLQNQFHQFPVGHGVHPDNLEKAVRFLKEQVLTN